MTDDAYVGKEERKAGAGEAEMKRGGQPGRHTESSPLFTFLTPPQPLLAVVCLIDNTGRSEGNKSSAVRCVSFQNRARTSSE